VSGDFSKHFVNCVNGFLNCVGYLLHLLRRVTLGAQCRVARRARVNKSEPPSLRFTVNPDSVYIHAGKRGFAVRAERRVSLPWRHDALRAAQRALAAFRALRRRCSGVILAARAFPPIFPPSRPSSDSIWDRRERAGCSGSGSVSGSLGRSPSNLWTARKPACTSSSGSLPDGFRIRLQRGTIRRAASSPWKTKVAHYRNLGRPAHWRVRPD